MTIAWTPEQTAILLADPDGNLDELTERVNAARGARRTWAAVDSKLRKLRQVPSRRVGRPKGARNRSGGGVAFAPGTGTGKCNPFASDGRQNFHADREHVRNLLREGAGFTDPECRRWAMAQAERWAA